jgi:hypothetical protein
MAKFYAEIQGARGAASRLGHTHIRSTTKSWLGEINVDMYIREDWRAVDPGELYVTVRACDHGGDNPVTLYHGRVGAWRELGPLGRQAMEAYRHTLEGRPASPEARHEPIAA